jgi:hypothetical protein
MSFYQEFVDINTSLASVESLLSHSVQSNEELFASNATVLEYNRELQRSNLNLLQTPDAQQGSSQRHPSSRPFLQPPLDRAQVAARSTRTDRQRISSTHDDPGRSTSSTLFSLQHLLEPHHQPPDSLSSILSDRLASNSTPLAFSTRNSASIPSDSIGGSLDSSSTVHSVSNTSASSSDNDLASKPPDTSASRALPPPVRSASRPSTSSSASTSLAARQGSIAFQPPPHSSSTNPPTTVASAPLDAGSSLEVSDIHSIASEQATACQASSSRLETTSNLLQLNLANPLKRPASKLSISIPSILYSSSSSSSTSPSPVGEKTIDQPVPKRAKLVITSAAIHSQLARRSCTPFLTNKPTALASSATGTASVLSRLDRQQLQQPGKETDGSERMLHEAGQDRSGTHGRRRLIRCTRR